MAWREVVGVVRDVRYRGLQEVQLDMYDPAAQTPMPATDLVVRTTGSPVSLLPILEREARALDPRVIISRVATLDAVVSQAQAPWRFSAWVVSLFAALAFLLCTVGLVSLVALDVANRRRELAIRSALGAAGRDLVSGVMRAAMVRVLIGVATGLALALAVTRALGALLVGITATELGTYAAVVSAVAAVALLASYWPARRAATVDPLAMLRRD
jgi:predicted lysophospholipase L1 biosynthesis ABC-type transport system permease subunit